MATILNLQRLTARLQGLAAAARKEGNVSVAVGYSAQYAIYVHENLTAVHETGQAKFLEQPARTLGPELAMDIAKGMKAKRTLSQCLLVAGLRLQRESQKLCPVETGLLRSSAFTRLENWGWYSSLPS